MNKSSLVLAVTLASGLGSAYGMEAERVASKNPVNTTIGLDLASSYIFRGFTVNKNLSLQPTLKASLGGLSVGTWASLPTDREEGEIEQEIDFFASYDIPIEALTLSLGAIEYTYPESEIDNDREVMLKAALAVPLNPSLAVYYGLAGAVEQSTYYELAGKQEIFAKNQFSSSLGATLGYLDRDEGDDGFSHLTLTAAASYALVTASVNYVAETDDTINDLSEQEQLFIATGTSYVF